MCLHGNQRLIRFYLTGLRLYAGALFFVYICKIPGYFIAKFRGYEQLFSYLKSAWNCSRSVNKCFSRFKLPDAAAQLFNIRMCAFFEKVGDLTAFFY